MNTPTWLKISQNSSIGEARTKSFLLDRFWILERSVDVEGADFLIQRRILRKELHSREPIRFGIVQVKFFESTETTQYIHNEYIVNKDSLPRLDFFLLCHTGIEDAISTFFLSTKDIVDNFNVVEKEGIKKYRLYGKHVLTDKYRIISKYQKSVNLKSFQANISKSVTYE